MHTQLQSYTWNASQKRMKNVYYDDKHIDMKWKSKQAPKQSGNNDENMNERSSKKRANTIVKKLLHRIKLSI